MRKRFGTVWICGGIHAPASNSLSNTKNKNMSDTHIIIQESHARTRTHTDLRIRSRTHTRTCTSTRTCTQAQVLAQLHTHTSTHKRAQRTRKHSYTYNTLSPFLKKNPPPKIHTSTIIKKYEHEPLKARGTEPHEKSQSLARAPLPAVRFAVAGRATRLSLWSKCQRMCTWKLFILLLSVSN